MAEGRYALPAEEKSARSGQYPAALPESEFNEGGIKFRRSKVEQRFGAFTYICKGAFFFAQHMRRNTVLGLRLPSVTYVIVCSRRDNPRAPCSARF